MREINRRAPRLRVRVVSSSCEPTALSLRLPAGGASATALKKALVKAGFQQGDEVDIVLAEPESEEVSRG
jgi:hypothetical protein